MCKDKREARGAKAWRTRVGDELGEETGASSDKVWKATVKV